MALEKISKSASGYERAFSDGLVQIMRNQESLMASVTGLIMDQDERAKLDEALRKDLDSIKHGVNRRERSLSVS